MFRNVPTWEQRYFDRDAVLRYGGAYWSGGSKPKVVLDCLSGTLASG